jgi:hypothetical protein
MENTSNKLASVRVIYPLDGLEPILLLIKQYGSSDAPGALLFEFLVCMENLLILVTSNKLFVLVQNTMRNGNNMF